MIKRTILAVAAAAGLAGGAQAATFEVDYAIGSGLLGNDLIVDAADHTGAGSVDLRANDTGNGAGPFTWVAVWDSLWDVGQEVSITGIALPLRSPNTGTANNTANGDLTFSFYELSGGTSVDAWDGVDNGETVLATATATFQSAGNGALTIPYVTFDAPINFTATSPGIAIHLDSTSSLRTRADRTPEAVDGIQYNRASGDIYSEMEGTVNFGHQWTLAGSPTFVPPAPPVRRHRFDAAIDAPGNATWTPLYPSFEQFSFAEDATPVDVDDPSVPGISKAYDVGARGQANVFEGTPGSRTDGSFEIWFKPDSLSGGDQIIYEAGGSGSGSYISLQGDTLSFYVNGAYAQDPVLTHQFQQAEWTQVVAVIHNTFDANNESQDDFIELYINGQLVGDTSDMLSDINDWSGGNDAGLGQDGQTIATGGPIDNSGDDNETVSFPFAGQIAIMEYLGSALTAQDVTDRYNAITTGTPGDYNGDGVVDTADYTVWRDNLGGDASVAFAAGSRAFGVVDGVGINDYHVWRSNYGRNYGAPFGAPFGAASVPEPGTVSLLLVALASFAGRRR